MNWSVFKHFHGVGTPPTYDVISTRSLNTVAKGLGSENHALLIASAPELLAAIKDMTDAFGHYCEGDPSDDEVAALNRAMGAINKATGVRA